MVNKVILLGRVGKNPEIMTFSDGGLKASFSLATSETWKDKNGEKQEKTEWHNIVSIGKLASIIEDYVSKGDLIYVEGKIQTRKYKDKKGVEKYTTEILINELKMLGGQKENVDLNKPMITEQELNDGVSF